MAMTLSLLMLPPVLQAEDFTTLEGDHYSNATIKKVDPDGLLIAYPDGVVKLKFKKLPPAIGVKYGYNPDAEAEYLEQEKLNQLAANQAALRARGISTPTPPVVQPLAQSPPQTSNSGTSTQLPTIPSSSSPSNSALTNGVSSQTDVSVSWFQHIKNDLKNYLINLLHRFFPWAFPSSAPMQLAPDPSPTPRPPTPQEIVDGVLAKSPIQSSELGNILQHYTSIALSTLNDRPSNIIATRGGS